MQEQEKEVRADLRSMPSTPMSQEEMEIQCAVVSACPEISEEDEERIDDYADGR